MMLSIGEFAKKTGLTVRTLRFYEEKGLLNPARSKDNDRRFYSERELQEVQKILSLKQLGFPLSEIEALIKGKKASLPKVLAAQLKALETRRDEVNAGIKSLKSAISALKEGDDLDIRTLTELIRMTTMTETAKKQMKKVYRKYFSEDQIKDLKSRDFSETDRQAYNQEWRRIMQRAAALSGSDPKTAEAQALARRARELIEMFTGGNEDIHNSLGQMYSEVDQWGKQLEVLMGMDIESFKKAQKFLNRALDCN